MEINGCEECCASAIHGMTEYDILNAHSMFISMSIADQRRWVHEYFSNHCLIDDTGASDLSRLKFILCGKDVCQPLWLATLAMSTSRFYDLRKLFMESTGPPERKKPRSLSAKTVAAISWMTSYFDR